MPGSGTPSLNLEAIVEEMTYLSGLVRLHLPMMRALQRRDHVMFRRRAVCNVGANGADWQRVSTKPEWLA